MSVLKPPASDVGYRSDYTQPILAALDEEETNLWSAAQALAPNEPELESYTAAEIGTEGLTDEEVREAGRLLYEASDKVTKALDILSKRKEV